MSNQQPATTVDSLIKFSTIKKKFSFVSKNQTQANSCSASNSESDSLSEHDDEEPQSNSVNKSPWKGSARLKENKSGSDDEEEKISRKKFIKKFKNQISKIIKIKKKLGKNMKRIK